MTYYKIKLIVAKAPEQEKASLRRGSMRIDKAYKHIRRNEAIAELKNRAANSLAVDNALKAPIAKDVRQWVQKPNRVDIKGIDQ